MPALLVLSEDRIAREIERWKQIDADEERWRRALRHRLLLLGLRCGATYVIGGLLAWGSLGMTGDWAQIAFWGGLLLSNAGPFAFGYAFWMRESGVWNWARVLVAVGSGSTFVRIIAAAASVIALVLLAVAVRALFVGYNSFDPVLFAGLYVWLFAFVAFSVVLIQTVRRIGGDQFYVLFALALLGAIGLAQLAPTIGEPNYCWFFGEYPRVAGRWLPPRTFRCTSLPFEIFGWFAGWGVGLWLMNRRGSRS